MLFQTPAAFGKYRNVLHTNFMLIMTWYFPSGALLTSSWSWHQEWGKDTISPMSSDSYQKNTVSY